MSCDFERSEYLRSRIYESWDDGIFRLLFLDKDIFFSEPSLSAVSRFSFGSSTISVIEAVELVFAIAKDNGIGDKDKLSLFEVMIGDAEVVGTTDTIDKAGTVSDVVVTANGNDRVEIVGAPERAVIL